MERGYLLVNCIVIYFRFIRWWGTLSWSLTLLYLATFMLESFAYLQLYQMSRPAYDAQSGQLIDSGQDLSSPGLTSNLFDIVYVTWIVHLFSLATDYAWLLYLTIPGYAGYKLWGLAKPFLQTSSSGPERKLTEAEARQLEKRERKKEHRGAAQLFLLQGPNPSITSRRVWSLRPYSTDSGANDGKDPFDKRSVSLSNLVGSFASNGQEGRTRDPAKKLYNSHANKSAVKSSKQDKWHSINSRILPIKSIGKTPIHNTPRLAHGLDRVLFNPGVYYLKDPRTEVYNFDPFLEHITQPDEFDYDKLAPYITSSKDETLLNHARNLGKQFVGSTSSTTQIMAHLYYLISHWKPVDIATLSEPFIDMPNGFTRSMRFPASVILRNMGDVYAIDADKSLDIQDSILLVLGKSMEKLVTSTKANYDQYKKINSWKSTTQDKAENDTNEVYNYADVGPFVLRSQLDCHDPRLPQPVFDLKTRAVLAVRLDMENYLEARGYQLTRHHGLLQSYEREYYDMIRSAFLKYNLQARIGNMDGVFVTYHNTAKVFGFEYIPRSKMDFHIFGNSLTGDRSFKVIIKLLGELLERFVQDFPQQTLRLTFDSRQKQGVVDIWVEVLPEEEVTEGTMTAANFASEADTTGEYDGEGGEDGSDEECYVPPGRVVRKYVVEAYSVLNDKETTEPFVLESSRDVWHIKWRVTTPLADKPEDMTRAEYQAVRRRQDRNLEKAMSITSDSEVGSFIRTLREISRKGLKMNEPKRGRKVTLESVMGYHSRQSH
ncbi:hypothetical protein EV182_000482 [Spiromyces aspiralis]|uniref:Uncharacterized protein n=1 Tax=Spiromyces aspiralis TaxID=68401 RepID=A0ACC1HI03_9FUNG|nr:hypothetical protein EV182_000482 [Spiromyces aspiralis]